MSGTADFSAATRPPRILLTGPAGCGKTTVVKRVVENLGRTGIAGFYTEEIRRGGTREGFKWRLVDGREGVLAHVNFKGLHKVGKYSVDTAGFENKVVPVLDPAADVELFIIDEIGKMECFSEKFVAAVRKLLDCDKAVLATVARKGGPFIAQVKKYPGVELLRLTRDNRNGLVARIVDTLRRLME